MRLGGPIFKKNISINEAVQAHKDLGFGAAFCPWIEDSVERDEYIKAFSEADIVLAEFGAYGINILDTDAGLRQKNIDEICKRLERADIMGVRCCVMHGGSVESGKWGTANHENMSEKSFIESVKIIQDIIDAVKPGRTKLVLETESYLFPDGPENYKRFIDAVDSSSFGVHLDPINITCTPRRVYFNDDFLKQCFAILGPWIVSCHAKDFNMEPVWPTVKIDETFIGGGVLNYQVYLNEIQRLDCPPTLMIEHLNAGQLEVGLKFIFGEAKRAGIVFEGSENRIEYKASDAGAYFAPHEE